MATAVMYRLNGVGEGIVRDVDAALMHIADNLLRAKGEPERLSKAIADENETYAFLEPTGATPHLAAILAREAKSVGRESVEIEIHDLDAKPGFDGVRLQHDLVNDLDPSYALLDALMEVWQQEPGEESIDDVELELASTVARATDQAKYGKGTEAKALERLRERQEAFGPPQGSALRIVPDAVPGEDPKRILDLMGGAAVDRFREILSKLDLSADAPAP